MSVTELNRDAAIAQAEEHARRAWLDAAYEATIRVARAHHEFTSDDVWELLAEGWPDLPVREPRAIGPVLLRATRAGVATIKSCDVCGTRKVMVMTRRPQANGSDQAVYVSGIYGERDPNNQPVEVEGDTLW